MNIKFKESTLNKAASILEIKSESLKKLIIKYNKFYVNNSKSFINRDLIKINYNRFKIKVFVKTGEIEIIIAQNNIHSESNEIIFKKFINNSLLENKLLIIDFFNFYKTYTLKESNKVNLYLKIKINEKNENTKILKKDISYLDFINYPDSTILQNSYENYIYNDYGDYEDFGSLIFESNLKGIYESELINKFKIKYDISTDSIKSLNKFYEIINY